MSGATISCATTSGFFAGTLDTQTVGSSQQGAVLFRQRGYISGIMGTINTGTSPVFGGATISQLYWDENTDSIILNVVGIFANSGFASLTFSGNSTVLSRSAASFNASGGNTSWTWGTIGGIPTPLGPNNAFSKVGFN